MSMTETLGSVATLENGLSPEMQARFERIKSLAKQNRRQYAIDKSASAKSVRAAKLCPTKSKTAAKKSAKPYFYNPATRD